MSLIDMNSQDIKMVSNKMKMNFESMKKKLSLEIQNATYHLKDSYFDDTSCATKNDMKSPGKHNQDVMKIISRKVDI